MEEKKLKNGLYRIVTKYFVAGFIIKDKKILSYAPILKKNLDYWLKKGKRIDNDR